ncbi:hypothetical protein KIF53_17505 [Chromobacterium subtsugae]|uniref:Uncharacterized protein n=2 Tax=Chromobacterium TaxID=535 RepID=A0ABS7FJF3_9NEIS|nr:hypothetical protein [Chromobacterium subtsugae]KZE88352.1 hypothetical protein AWB61_00270 [Chromobacterium sp. F49]KUM04274.1 hypothetical protein Cv017_00520 [Chromobacterium subtsugae]MBW7568736.1 hypothetical protein [Chromobacterium subtsugae]MBW8289434.1 hypothetical protein [Chromobacterium subtsugae]OBU85937.1 hypothetical protein MY55_14095 [Chromobacterium subtsugae]
MPLFDVPAPPSANPLTIPYRAPAPRNYAEARDLLVKSSLRAVDIAKLNLQKKLEDQPQRARRANFIASQGRIQAGLGFAKLALLADGTAKAPVTLYWKIGEKAVFQARGTPTADVCDGVRRIWMSAIWYDIWEKGIAKSQASLDNLPAIMFQSGAALFNDRKLGMAQASQQVRETLGSGGELRLENRSQKPFYQFSLDSVLSNACLNGNMTYTDTGAALPLYGAPYPGLFRP